MVLNPAASEADPAREKPTCRTRDTLTSRLSCRGAALGRAQAAPPSEDEVAALESLEPDSRDPLHRELRSRHVEVPYQAHDLLAESEGHRSEVALPPDGLGL